MPVESKADLDVLLTFNPVDWATDYNGTWLTNMALLVTVLAVPAVSRSDPAFRGSTGVGTLRITVQAQGGLLASGGISLPSTATTLLTHGSWGDVVCDGGLYVFSSNAVVVAFSAPVNASYVPSSYTLSISRTSAFASRSTYAAVVAANKTEATFVLPARFTPSSLRFYLEYPQDANLYVRASASPPFLPTLVTQDLPQAVPLVPWPIGGTGGCGCESVRSGAGCGDSPGLSEGLAPKGPIIGTLQGSATCGSWSVVALASL